jgi:hypothetical protein
MKIRKAFVMSVYAGAEQEYEKRHNPIWPELERVLKDYGVLNLLDLQAHRDAPALRPRRNRKRGAVGVHCLEGGVPKMAATHGRS